MSRFHLTNCDLHRIHQHPFLSAVPSERRRHPLVETRYERIMPSRRNFRRGLTTAWPGIGAVARTESPESWALLLLGS